MKIIQVIPFIGAESSGPAYCLPGLCRSLTKAGGEVELHTLAPLPDGLDDIDAHAYPWHSFPYRRLGRSPEMLAGLKRGCADADIVHTGSLWMMPNIYPDWAICNSPAKLVLSPHGTLVVFTSRKMNWKKKILWHLWQKQVLEHTAMFHATCEKEYLEIRAAGFRQPVAVIPFGMDFISVDRKKTDRRILLFLGRIHPIKAIDRLLLAWNKVSAGAPEWDFVIAGPDGGQESYLRSLVQKHRISRVCFAGEINGEAKYRMFANADLYALPSFTENFGVTVAEALAAGTPVIASRMTPWSGIVQENCGWWVENDVESLAVQLKESLALSRETLEEMGENGRRWMQRDFAWDATGEKMMHAYQWLLQREARPDYVITD